MECPNCHTEIPGTACPRCGAQSPEEGRFCMHCGAKMEVPDADPVNPDDPYDIETRVLCSDGACTGIIVNGKCTECGKPHV